MNFVDNVSEIIDDLDIVRKYDKAIIKHRFLNEISYYEKKRDETKRYYNIFRFIVTTGSILLPAVLSMGQMDPAKLPKNFDTISYWFSWTISLMVTGSNGFLQLFSLDKNFFSYSMVVEQLKTEGWQYFGLSGKYEDFSSHQVAYKTFTKSVESIKRKQIDQEFSSGKGDNKKKKFDFKGEMQKFAEEQNADLKIKENEQKKEKKEKKEQKEEKKESNISSSIQEIKGNEQSSITPKLIEGEDTTKGISEDKEKKENKDTIIEIKEIKK